MPKDKKGAQPIIILKFTNNSSDYKQKRGPKKKANNPKNSGSGSGYASTGRPRKLKP